MKKLFASCFALMVGLVQPACSENSSDGNELSITPEEMVSLSENGGTQTYDFILVGAHSAPVQVVVTNSDVQHLSIDKTVVTFHSTSSDDGVWEFVTAKCINNDVKDGDHLVSLTMTAMGLDSELPAKQWVRYVNCIDDDTSVVVDPVPVDPVPVDPDKVCTDGQILCVDGQNYKSCNVALNAWSDTVTACPQNTPVCNTSLNACEAKPVVSCNPVCNGDLIRLCSADGTLLDASACAAGSACRTSNGVSSCTVIQTPPDSGYIELSTTELEVFEGGSKTFTVVPATEPSSTVNVSLSVTDATEGVLDNTMLSFTKQNWSQPQTVKITAPRDGEVDGNQNYQITFKVVSSDSQFNGRTVKPVEVTSIDTEGDDCYYDGSKSLTIRAMAANITSGNYSAYSPGHGVRIFKAMKPDIVMIQEFNWNRMKESDNAALKLMSEAFDSSYYVFRGKGDIPNGIISRYPIIDAGAWESNKISNRDWNWALIDLPGRKELLVLSVHLSTSDNKQEAPSLMTKIDKKIAADRSRNLEYYLMIGGDFNSNFKGNGSLKEFFSVNTDLPVDQYGESATNVARKSVIDHVFVDKAFERYEVPVEIGDRSYLHGHVFDSRVYQKTGELGDVPPVRADDSGALNMQHMAVIRDFEFSL